MKLISFFLICQVFVTYVVRAQMIGVPVEGNYKYFSALPDSLKSSAYYSLKNYSFGKFCKEIKNPKSVKKLSIETDSVIEISNQIRLFTNLTDFYVKAKAISRISPNISECGKLQSIIIGNIDCEVPEELFTIQTIVDISLTGSFHSIPKTLNNLSLLKDLRLFTENLTTFPSDISNLKNLEFLLIVSSLTTFPRSICNLVKLKHLFFEKSHITKIPNNISHLKNLLVLVLDRNEIDTLPNELYELKYLNTINLSNNKITNISPRIKNLRNLGEIYLSGNQLRSLPNEISFLKRGIIDLKGNPITKKELERIKLIMPNFKVQF